MLNKQKQLYITALLNKELRKALGCTEPIAITYAVAQAIELLEEEPTLIQLSLSTNMIKNTMGAAVPSTGGMSGIELAALCGVFGADTTKELEIFSSITEESIQKAKDNLGKGLVEISLEKKAKNTLYIKVIATSKNHTSSVTIADEHTYIVSKKRDGKIIFKQPYLKKMEEGDKEYVEITLKDIIDFCYQEPVPLNDLFSEAIEITKNISNEGLKGDYGLSVGKTLWENMENGLLSQGLANQVIAKTAAGVDVRMDGGNFPVMSNSGSGNQGITTTMGVVSAAEYLNIQDEQTVLRAVAISNSVAIYIKQHLDRLSAICGVTIAATGVSCGIAYLLGGNFNTFEECIQNMIGTVTGMFCDGAKPGCASKTATCLSAAVTSAVLAVNGKSLNQRNGIVNKNVEDSIKTLGTISVKEKSLDSTILDIMLHK